MRKGIHNNIRNRSSIKTHSILIIFCFITQFIYGIDIHVTPKQIYFNYESGYSKDALTISDPDGNEINESEWSDFFPDRHKFAYIRGQEKRSIKVQFDSNYQGNVNLIVNLSIVTDSGVGIGTIKNLFIPNYNTTASVEETRILELSGIIPPDIGLQKFQWRWEIYAMPIIISTYCPYTETTITSHHYYTLFDVPQVPMAEPWESVLDLACKWASGQTTELGIATKITENAYNNDFPIKKSYANWTTHATLPIFKLKGFLNAIYVDCEDMSAVVQVFTNALGGSNIKVKKIQGEFFYTSILPIGEIKWIGIAEGDYIASWHFHQVAWLDNVFDACIQLKHDNVPYIPVNRIIEGEYDSYKKDLYSGGIFNPLDTTSYTTVE